MRRSAYVWLFLVLVFSSLVFAAEFKLYPGAKIDEKATKEQNEFAAAAKMSGTKAKVYITTDSFQKVATFYKGIAKEFAMPRASGTSGKPRKSDLFEGDLWKAYFIFDGAKDLTSSKLWVKVQQPYISEDVRDITAIVVTEKR